MPIELTTASDQQKADIRAALSVPAVADLAAKADATALTAEAAARAAADALRLARAANLSDLASPAAARASLATGAGPGGGYPRSPALLFGKSLVAWYDFRQGADATKLYDRSPLQIGSTNSVGNQGALGASTAAPSWTSTGLSFDGVNDTVALPAGVLARVKGLYCFGTFTGTGAYCVVLSGSNSADISWTIETDIGIYGVAPMIWKGGVGIASKAAWDVIPPGANGASGWGYSQDGVSDQYYLAGRPASQINAASETSTFGRTGTATIGTNPGNGALSPYKGVLSGMALVDRPMTDAEAAELDAFFAADLVARGGSPYANPATTRQLFVEGDSISTTVFGTVTDWPTQMTLTQPWAVTNRALQGNQLGNIYPGSRHRSLDRYAPAAPKNVYCVFAGTNDFFWHNAAPADVFELLRLNALEAVAAGFRVVVVPMLSRTGYDAQKNAYNALINGYAWPSAVAVVPASALAGLIADGASANAANFSDGTHPTTAGMAVIAAAVAAILNAMG